MTSPIKTILAVLLCCLPARAAMLFDNFDQMPQAQGMPLYFGGSSLSAPMVQIGAMPSAGQPGQITIRLRGSVPVDASLSVLMQVRTSFDGQTIWSQAQPLDCSQFAPEPDPYTGLPTPGFHYLGYDLTFPVESTLLMDGSPLVFALSATPIDPSADFSNFALTVLMAPGSNWETTTPGHFPYSSFHTVLPDAPPPDGLMMQVTATPEAPASMLLLGCCVPAMLLRRPGRKR